jgi:hypothetical protein
MPSGHSRRTTELGRIECSQPHCSGQTWTTILITIAFTCWPLQFSIVWHDYCLVFLHWRIICRVRIDCWPKKLASSCQDIGCAVPGYRTQYPSLRGPELPPNGTSWSWSTPSLWRRQAILHKPLFQPKVLREHLDISSSIHLIPSKGVVAFRFPKRLEQPLFEFMFSSFMFCECKFDEGNYPPGDFDYKCQVSSRWLM